MKQFLLALEKLRFTPKLVFATCVGLVVELHSELTHLAI
jgi:hypothetical protein